LEARLILALLGPLAIASGLLEFTALFDKDRYQDLGDAIRTVCNSTLTLLYTAALLIWGFLLNRNRAWRTDGGTALFGLLAILLAVIGTGVNYLEVKEDRARWLEGVVWCILTWQSWVGFWWWVGAGMYAGEVADREKKEAKRRAREERRVARKKGQIGDSVARRIKRRVAHRGEGDTDLTPAQSNTSTARLTAASASTRRRHTHAADRGGGAEEAYELDDMRPGQAGSLAQSGSSRSQSSSSPGAIAAFFMRPRFMGALRHLRAAHNEAAKDRAEEDATKKKGLRRWGLGGFKHEGGSTASTAVDNESVTDETASAWDHSSHSGSSVPSTYRMPEGQQPSARGSRGDSGSPSSPTTRNAVASSSSASMEPAGTEQAVDVVWEGRGMDENSGAWWWWGPLRKARLRDVTTYN
jgi:hypothetical protein